MAKKVSVISIFCCEKLSINAALNTIKAATPVMSGLTVNYTPDINKEATYAASLLLLIVNVLPCPDIRNKRLIPITYLRNFRF